VNATTHQGSPVAGAKVASLHAELTVARQAGIAIIPGF